MSKIDVTKVPVDNVQAYAQTVSIRTAYNSHKFMKTGEINTRPSKTIPDQTMSLKQLLERFARGIPAVGNASTPIYEGDDIDLPDIKKMDLAEIQALKDEVQSQIDEHRKAMNEAHQKDVKEKFEKNERERFKKWQEDENKKKPNKDQNPEK